MINAQILQGHWNEIKGILKQHWGDLTGDDLRRFSGDVDQLVGMIHARRAHVPGDPDFFGRDHRRRRAIRGHGGRKWPRFGRGGLARRPPDVRARGRSPS